MWWALRIILLAHVTVGHCFSHIVKSGCLKRRGGSSPDYGTCTTEFQRTVSCSPDYGNRRGGVRLTSERRGRCKLSGGGSKDADTQTYRGRDNEADGAEPPVNTGRRTAISVMERNCERLNPQTGRGVEMEERFKLFRRQPPDGQQRRRHSGRWSDGTVKRSVARYIIFLVIKHRALCDMQNCSNSVLR